METQKSNKTKTILGWILSGVVTLFLLFDAFGKLTQPEMVVKGTLDLGYPETIILELGIVLLISTLLYAFPKTAFIGAILLTGYLGGAVATHVRVENPLFSHTFFPIYMGIFLWLGLFLRYPSLSLWMPPKSVGSVQ